MGELLQFSSIQTTAVYHHFRTSSGRGLRGNARRYLDGEVDAELASASAVGLTALRVFMHNMAYDASPTHFLASIERFLTMAHGHGLGVGFVFFDDCWNHAGASTTVQCQERDGLHNACSMASPQDCERTNSSRFKPYVTDIIRAHAKDPRVLWWGA